MENFVILTRSKFLTQIDIQLLLNSTRMEPEHAQHFNFWDEGGRWGERGVRGEWGDHPRW